MGDGVGSRDWLHRDERAEGHHLAGPAVRASHAANVETRDVARRGAKARLGLQLDAIDPWSERKTPALQAEAILARLRARLGSIQEAVVVVFPPPPIRGISSGGGFQFELQSVAGGSLQDLDVAARQIMDAARQRPELAATFTGFRSGVPQLDARVDRTKAKALGVPLSDVFSSLQIFLGSLYVNDFNAFGHRDGGRLRGSPDLG